MLVCLCACVLVCLCACVLVCLCVCVFVCLCAYERERGRENETEVCLCGRISPHFYYTRFAKATRM